MFVALLGESAWRAVGEQIASMLTFINSTYRETRQVKLASAIRAPSRSSSSTSA